MGLGIKKNDTVIVITGKEKGKSGRVLAVYPMKDSLLDGESQYHQKTYETNQEIYAGRHY